MKKFPFWLHRLEMFITFDFFLFFRFFFFFTFGSLLKFSIVYYILRHISSRKDISNWVNVVVNCV